MVAVCVINKDGKPLMATIRYGRVRHLLNRKQAKIVSKNPFTIQLLYEVGNYTQNQDTHNLNCAKNKHSK